MDIKVEDQLKGEDHFKPLYKAHKRAESSTLSGVFDPLNCTEAQAACLGFKKSCEFADSLLGANGENTDFTAWESIKVPGFKVISKALSQAKQTEFASSAVTEWLGDKRHLTNLDLHSTIPRPIELFGTNKDLQTKLRWATLGGQYDWTNKVYPSWQLGSDLCPAMPENLANFCSAAFGHTPQAAIVNYYRQGDILMPHQDVAEQSDACLASISLGCECIFYAGPARYGCEPHAIVLRSGDAIVLANQSRSAWHGVGRVITNTCPEYLENEFWAKTRVNISVRQMV